MMRKITIATLVTTNFSFMAVGKNVNQAERALVDAISIHCMQYGISSERFWNDWREAIQLVQLAPGESTRDGELLRPPL